MNLSYVYRAYPTKEQQILLQKTFGAVRFVYNYFLNFRNEKWEKEKVFCGYNECSKELTALKKREEYRWLQEVNSVALQDSLRRLDSSFRRYFQNVKRKKEKAKPPIFLSKKSKQLFSFFLPPKIEGGRIELPKIGWVKAKISRPIEGKVVKITVSFEAPSEYYITFVCKEVPEKICHFTGKKIGIDLGIKSLIVTSDGEEFENRRYGEKREKRISRLRKTLSRRNKGSKRYEKARVLLGKTCKKIRRQRRDYLEKITTKLVEENDFISVESLDIKKLSSLPKIGKKIRDASWGTLVFLLKTKAEKHHKTFVQIDKYFPSSQRCSVCGNINKTTKNLFVRKWECPSCGFVFDRDFNAARNILQEGLRLSKR